MRTYIEWPCTVDHFTILNTSITLGLWVNSFRVICTKFILNPSRIVLQDEGSIVY